MKKIREKLRSQSGASILIALLFFLLCAMVGASVLMAAASNAGKSRSSREEQQKYLTLSSALQLVCDELTAAEYTGKYDYTYTPSVTTKNEDGSTTTTPAHRTYTQVKGEYIGELSKEGNNVLPLRDELDWLFAQDFNRWASTESEKYTYITRNGIQGPGTVHKLTLTVQGQTNKPGLNDTPVEVTVTLMKDYSFRLTASLDGYSMYADLVLRKGCTPPQLEKSPVGNNPQACVPIKWEVSQITREATT